MIHLKQNTSFLNQIPFEQGPQSPREVHGAIASWVKPRAFPDAQVIAWSHDLKKQFGLNQSVKDELLSLFRGLTTLHSQGNWATCYGGHQFGHWADQLGDGRAQTLGFIEDLVGNSFEWQMKGFGITPYSRGGDGYAVLRSSLREFVASEAMFHLGVPTTRALCLLVTNESVIRDIVYSGNPKPEPGALCLRVAPSFIRFGHFEILAARKEKDLMQKLFDWIHQDQTHFSVLDFFNLVTRKTLDLILEWMQLGFVHGVMNTDNMSVHGLTLDYGPYGWLSFFDPNFTPNTTDFRDYRYAWGKQYEIGIWNLSRLAWALLTLEPDQKSFIEILKTAQKGMEKRLLETFAIKIGIDNNIKENLEITQELLVWLQHNPVDFTLFFKWLEVTLNPELNLEPVLMNISYSKNLNFESFKKWLSRYQKINRRYQKRAPAFIFRNHLLFKAIEECELLLSRSEFQKELKHAKNPQKLFPKLNEIMEQYQNPFDLPKNFRFDQPLPYLFDKTPSWAFEQAGCNQLSCSS
jgi:uncharacterized protein YdiU (UPF0061 family)